MSEPMLFLLLFIQCWHSDNANILKCPNKQIYACAFLKKRLLLFQNFSFTDFQMVSIESTLFEKLKTHSRANL